MFKIAITPIVDTKVMYTHRRLFIIHVIVSVPPVVTQTPTSIHFDYLFEDGQQAAFWCNVYGIPQPNVYWKMVITNFTSLSENGK